MNKTQILEYLQSQKQYLFNNFGLNKIGIFGSYSRNENTNSSDIDILFEVDKEKNFSMFKYLELNKFLEDNLHTKVDLVREGTIKDSIKPYIQKDVIYV